MKELITLEELKKNYRKARKRLEDFKNSDSPKNIIDKCLRERIIKELDSLLLTYSKEGIGKFRITFLPSSSCICIESLEDSVTNSLLHASGISTHSDFVSQIIFPDDVSAALSMYRYPEVIGTYETNWDYLICKIKEHLREIGLTLTIETQSCFWIQYKIEYEY